MRVNKEQALSVLNNINLDSSDEVRQAILNSLVEQFQVSTGELVDELRALAEDVGREDITEEERRAFRQLATFLAPLHGR